MTDLACAWMGCTPQCDNLLMLVEKNVPLQSFNSFHIVAKAHALARIGSEADVLASTP